MSEQERRRVRFTVTGHVQGVGFRAATQRKATQLGVVGHVQNRADGGVEGEAEGPVSAVAAFTLWLHKGPPLAAVSRVDVEEQQALGTGTGFAIER